MFVNNLLTGIGRRLFQRLMVIFVIALVLRSIGFFTGPSEDGTFRSTSSELRSSQWMEDREEKDLWGAGSDQSKNRRDDRQRDSSRPPVYDPVEDGGWGSN